LHDLKRKKNQEGKEREQRESVLTRTRGRTEKGKKKDYRNSKDTFNLLLKADTIFGE